MWHDITLQNDILHGRIWLFWGKRQTLRGKIGDVKFRWVLWRESSFFQLCIVGYKQWKMSSYCHTSDVYRDMTQAEDVSMTPQQPLCLTFRGSEDRYEMRSNSLEKFSTPWGWLFSYFFCWLFLDIASEVVYTPTDSVQIMLLCESA